MNVIEIAKDTMKIEAEAILRTAERINENFEK